MPKELSIVAETNSSNVIWRVQVADAMATIAVENEKTKKWSGGRDI